MSASSKPSRRRPQVRERSDLPFELRRSPIQGTGAFAVRIIKRGERIAEYEGERISSEEADRRYDQARMRRHHTFLFTLDDETVIDGACDGNASIYINHSCEPNCIAYIEDDTVWVYAKRTIQPGEELTYDYKFQRTGDAETDAELESFYPCRCGAKTCRGTMLVPSRKPRKRAGARAES